jgi:diguanylate cyclase (GGDEF)-like protein/PAS domain S-box-containing protein
MKFFSLATFFIRNMKFHERMTLLAIILFIPLITFSYLFISSKKHELHLIENELYLDQANVKLIKLMQTLQYQRGMHKEYLTTNPNKLNNRTIIKALSGEISQLIENEDHSFLQQWEKTVEKIEMIQYDKDHYSIDEFKMIMDIIQNIRLLMGHIQDHSAIHAAEQDYIQRILLFQQLPSFIEEMAILRGSISKVFTTKQISSQLNELILIHYYTMRQIKLEIKSKIPYTEIEEIKSLFNNNSWQLFDKAFKKIQKNDFHLDGKEFFDKSTIEINRLYDLLYKISASNFERLEELHNSTLQTYTYVTTLLIFSIVLAIYFYFAIYILIRKNLTRLKNGAIELASLDVSHSITLQGNDEFSDIANALNSLAETLKFDNTLINKYIPLSRTNIDGVITEVTEAFTILTGYSQADIVGKTHAILKHPENTNEYFEKMWATILNGKAWDAELLNKHKNGSNFWVKIHIIPHFDCDGSITGFTSLRRDITERKKALKLARTDDLTQIYNRKFFNETLDLEIKKSKRYDHTFSIVMIDIDHFKRINDTYGHLEGDNVLKRFAELISSMLRTTDVFSRWGGEEFMILLPHTTLDEATTVAESLRTTIENFSKSSHKGTTISVGVTSFSPLNDDKEELLLRCDKNLYKAKEMGRNRVISA